MAGHGNGMMNLMLVIATLQLAFSSSNAQTYPYDGAAAMSGNVGPDSACASVAPTNLIASAPPNVWNNGLVGCGRSVIITCFPGLSACSDTPTVTVSIIDQACTDCGEKFILSQDAFFTIAANNADTIAIGYYLN